MTFTENSFSLPILEKAENYFEDNSSIARGRMEIFFFLFFGEGGGGWVTWVLGGMEKDQSSSTDYKEGTVENWLPTNFR